MRPDIFWLEIRQQDSLKWNPIMSSVNIENVRKDFIQYCTLAQENGDSLRIIRGFYDKELDKHLPMDVIQYIGP